MADDAQTIESVVQAVRQDRLWDRHMDIATFGATGRGGVNRQALSPEDAAARVRVLDWARARGFTAAVDDIGNVFIRRAGSDKAADPVVAGSHIDSQPTGGNFDGVYGVLAALEVLDAAADADIATKRPIEAAIWTNEEGSRFQPTTMGSTVFAGSLPLETALDTTDADGMTVRDALTQTLDRMAIDRHRDFRAPMAAYLEAHIEQGPVLEAEAKTIGVVAGIQGLRWFQVEVKGDEAHAGTTPLGRRKDAFVAASAMVRDLQALMADPDDVVRFTVGRFEVTPNSPNTVPGHVLFTIDFRHPDNAVLKRLGDQVEPICQAAAGGCAVSLVETLNSPPTDFDAEIRRMIGAAAARQAMDHLEIVSGATHDAKYMADLCPSGMIFVPCKDGISHNETESATPEDLACGARVLAEAMIRLANR